MAIQSYNSFRTCTELQVGGFKLSAPSFPKMMMMVGVQKVKGVAQILNLPHEIVDLIASFNNWKYLSSEDICECPPQLTDLSHLPALQEKIAQMKLAIEGEISCTSILVLNPFDMNAYAQGVRLSIEIENSYGVMIDHYLHSRGGGSHQQMIHCLDEFITQKSSLYISLQNNVRSPTYLCHASYLFLSVINDRQTLNLVHMMGYLFPPATDISSFQAKDFCRYVDQHPDAFLMLFNKLVENHNKIIQEAAELHQLSHVKS